MYFPKPSLNENDLAIIERGDTAAHAIEAGQYVSWHGKTGKANAAIAIGDTLDDAMFDYDEDGVINSLPKRIILKDESGDHREVYEFPNGIAILTMRIVVSVSITGQSGGMYYGDVSPFAFGYTFASPPVVTAQSCQGGTNAYVWFRNEPTATQTPGFIFGRGSSITANIVLLVQAIGIKAAS